MTLLYIFLAAAALGILVFIHELGHYIAAKIAGMKVEVFSIGFGKPLLRWRWNDVDWQLGWLPFGGYVKIFGMELSKKEKKSFTEPYDIPNGFFSKSPWKRIFLATAGPLANFILAFLIFAGIWASGGREKPFTELTQVIGWVDPRSEAYSLGLRPGDVLTHYNGKRFTNAKDLIYAAMLGGKEVKLRGYHVDYDRDQRKTPFTYTIAPYSAPSSLKGILTTGIVTMAHYMIYDPANHGGQISDESPMQGSGIQPQDQVVWANGELIFSLPQLSNIMNDNHVLLTVKRNHETFLTQQPNISVVDLIFPSYVRNEILDWQYETGLKVKWPELKVLPYVLSPEGHVEAPLDFIDEESEREAFPLHPYSETLTRRLEPGDRIVAVGGIPVKTAYQILELVQSPHVQMIVRKNVPARRTVSWKQADALFLSSYQWDDLQKITATIGTAEEMRESGDYLLLKSVEPKPRKEFDQLELKAILEDAYAKQKEEAEKIDDPEKRNLALDYLEKYQNRYLLGIDFKDRQVLYNPSPFYMFLHVFAETWQTLKALVTGYLHPKWISGPVGIVQVIHYGWTIGSAEALFWIAAISLNLGVLNLLPIPGLDGGYICLSLWEIITRRRLKAKTMERLIVPFVILLIALLVFLTFQDLSRLFFH